MPAPSPQPDPSFQQRAISQTEQKCGLPDSEHDFTECPRRQLTELHKYEVGRESPRLQRIILAWRDQTGVNTFNELLWKCRHTLTQIAPEPGHLYAFCPEWPRLPYLDIPQAERQRRFEELFGDKTELKALATQLEIRPPLPGELSPEALSFITELLGGNIHIRKMRINWGSSDRELRRQFDAYLKFHRPRKPKNNVSERSLRAELKALGAYRLLKAYGGISNYSNIVPQIFIFQSEWIKAQRRIERIIKSVENSD
jgi:hypothetical protein